MFALTHQYIGTPAAITPRPAEATPGASTTVLITIAKLTMQNNAGVASAGLGVMAAGVPMYWWVKRRNGERKA